MPPDSPAYYATFARIYDVTDDEVERFTSQLSNILDQFTKLDELEFAGGLKGSPVELVRAQARLHWRRWHSPAAIPSSSSPPSRRR